MVVAPPPKCRLQTMLQAAVQTIQWTYGVFWQVCPQQGVLVWRNGYYNGAIKTRKTVQPTEVTTEEATLQRSQQLRELYDSLVTAESSHLSRRPSAALSPEDLSDTEWFYLMCASFSFAPGVGLAGRTYQNQQHIWLNGANQADAKLFSRAILAKSAGIKTVVCIPHADGVVEFGTTEWFEEEDALVKRIKCTVSECEAVYGAYSTSNPSESMEPPSPMPIDARDEEIRISDEEIVELVDEEYDAGSNDLNSAPGLDKLLLPAENMAGDDDEVDRAVITCMPAECHDAIAGRFDRPTINSGICGWKVQVQVQESIHFSETVSTLFESSTRPSDGSSADTAFSKYSGDAAIRRFNDGAPAQWALKYMLFTVPLLYTKSRDHLITEDDSSTHSRASTAAVAQEDLGGASHVLAERRRREKLNERFVTLRSLVPFVTRMDKASILGDTIEYLKQLCERIQELETRTRQMDSDAKQRDHAPALRRNGSLVVSKPSKKRRLAEAAGCVVGDKKQKERAPATQMDVSIIESDALIEVKRVHDKDGGFLLKLMKILGKFSIEVVSVRSWSDDGVFAAELRAKVKDNLTSGRKASIMEVKRAINQIIITNSS